MVDKALFFHYIPCPYDPCKLSDKGICTIACTSALAWAVIQLSLGTTCNSYLLLNKYNQTSAWSLLWYATFGSWAPLSRQDKNTLTVSLLRGALTSSWSCGWDTSSALSANSQDTTCPDTSLTTKQSIKKKRKKKERKGEKIRNCRTCTATRAASSNF